ncbi:MAG: lipoyl synthase [Anaerolineaceae bacterium 4572_5.2]|nr:MAG: lipoyl synthase [Anaerolineaceae bacterium 4572_5.2]
MPATPTRDRISPEESTAKPLRRPEWIKISPEKEEATKEIRKLMRKQALHTVCEEAMCPNLGECFGAGTATFLMLGDVCTRSCGFCDVKHGMPKSLDWDEAERVAQAVKSMDLKHAVSVEVLIPDFKGSVEALKIVMDAKPDILNHNVESVPRLFKSIQPQSNYAKTEAVLRNAKKLMPNGLTKSGIMVGLGEEMDEIKEVIRDLRRWNVDILTIGQYLQPSRKHLPISRYYTLEEFAELEEFGLELGFRWVESGPLVRSSYHAAEQVRGLR